MQLRRFNNSSIVQRHEIFHNICEKKMSKLKDINIPYVKSTSTMGWDELNVLKKWGPFILTFYTYFPIAYPYV